ncbi:lycopene cyclase domain protein [Saccharomonospora marina XMU15]|uniref:Lycopene cyclase domain protein n=1 Tax=Saccharomonospora marina XMU15 TaxID=882083 RepID=H5XAM8_9PSEU|nr:lycopene cyclase domain-containing protein [Saccharomonospora marina]EHR51533.1 lycopene cyclase domain protein [Saccharomonospora marina XMU15]
MIGLGYTVPALLSVAAVVLIEVAWLRTGLFRRKAYWLTLAIVFAFQVPVDGWLTKLSAPIVHYDAAHYLGLRFPLDIPVEDFLFGFSLVTATLLGWSHHERKERTQQVRISRGTPEGP